MPEAFARPASPEIPTVQFCMIRRFLQDILRPGFRIAAHFASMQPGCLHQCSVQSVMLGRSPVQAAKFALVVLLRALEAKRPVPGKTAYKARIRNFLRSKRAQAVAAKFAASMKSVCGDQSQGGENEALAHMSNAECHLRVAEQCLRHSQGLQPLKS